MNRIWEKKYGKNANHLKKQREVEAAADPSGMQGSRREMVRDGGTAVFAAQGRGVYRSSIQGKGGYGLVRGRGSRGRDETDSSMRQQDGGWASALRTRQGRERGAHSGTLLRGGRGQRTNVSHEERSDGAGNSRIAESHTQKHERHAERPLHPSWEAKRKLKAKENGVVVPSQGTKLKFT